MTRIQRKERQAFSEMFSTNAPLGYRRGRAQARPSSEVPVLPPESVDTSAEELAAVLRALRYAQGDQLHAEAQRLRIHMEAPLYAETHKHCVAMQAMRCTAAPWWRRLILDATSSRLSNLLQDPWGVWCFSVAQLAALLGVGDIMFAEDLEEA